MGSGYSKAKKQAKLMEQQLETMRNELQNKKVTGTSSAGLVTVVLNGEKELLEIKIKPECLDPNDPEGLQDLIKAACEDGYQRLSSESGPLPFGLNL
ncbi:MAG: YbaB/EbfC family nucleoid-associated protein [Chlamydiales bacterium]|jgi:DNA-binding YbaB/EbfC family protein|nr:YbaB/EbfC family nucleoid-associated protein [Chlamydiales bacterium]